MPQPYPNHLVSVPLSIMSLKHYFRVHDQGFARTALYGVFLGVLLTAVSMMLGLAGFLREAPGREARQAAELETALAVVTVKDGKAASDQKQPAILWQDCEERPGGESASEADARPKLRTLLVVLDTTGAVTTWEKAAEFAGCAEPQRIVVFGQKAIVSTDPAKGQEQGGGQEACAYTDQARLAEVQKLLEDKGGKLPEFTLENGLAKFKLDPDKVHVLVNRPELLALVDTTGKNLPPTHAWQVATQEHPDMQPPEFLALLTATSVTLKPIYEKAVRTLDLEGRGDVSAGDLSRWVAHTARQVRYDVVMRGILPNSFKMVMYACFEVLILALICSVAGLLVSAALRAGLPYTQVLTMAVYAMTPARLVLPFLVALAGVSGQWAMALPFVVGMGYTAMATYRTARELGGTAVAPAPRL
ncbi:MAG TPA: DUF1189 family protein [Planctomycetota bacterium]|nr:DUF1189 family protein [Planctomycetota bacterium]